MSAPRYTFIAGNDDFLVNRLARQAFAEAAEGIDDEYSRETVSGFCQTVGEVPDAIGRFRAAVETLPMFSPRKAIWFKDINFLADSVTGRSEATVEQIVRLQEILARIDPAEVGVVLSASPVDRRRREFKALQGGGKFADTGSGKNAAEAIARMLEDECRQLGVTLPAGARDLLVGKLAGNARLCLEEIRKLATYLGDEGDRIDEKLVDALVPAMPESEFFEVAEAFYALDLKWTLEALRRHFFAGNVARPVLATLQNRNRLLIQLRALVDAGYVQAGKGRGMSRNALDRAANAFREHFGDAAEDKRVCVLAQNAWYLGRIASRIDRLSLRRLIDFQEAFADAFRGLLARPREDEEAILREMAVRCLG